MPRDASDPISSLGRIQYEGGAFKCPHCMVTIHPAPELAYIGQDSGGVWLLWKTNCAACRDDIYILFSLQNNNVMLMNRPVAYLSIAEEKYLIRPKTSQRPPAPPGTPIEVAEDYREACLVFSDSAKASAALSRRCLQNLLVQAANVKKGDLADQIQEVLDSRQLPRHLAESIDAVRNIGNFAAHPNKSKVTGEIAPVEPEEAEWNLEVIQMLLDFYYVQQVKNRERLKALNQKLAGMSKPPVKQP